MPYLFSFDDDLFPDLQIPCNGHSTRSVTLDGLSFRHVRSVPARSNRCKKNLSKLKICRHPT